MASKAELSERREASRQEVARFVRWAVDQAGEMSDAEFARRCGFSPSQISDWTRGRNAPSSANLVRIIERAGLTGRLQQDGAPLVSPVSNEDLREDHFEIRGEISAVKEELRRLADLVREFYKPLVDRVASK